jgi:hypothetical protein
VNISGQVDTARDDASARYDNFDGRFDGLDTSVTGVGTNLTSGFANIQDLMNTYNTGMNTQFDNVNTGVGVNNTAIGGNATALNQLSTNVDGGFDAMGGRFDTVDTANTNIQGAVDQGFVDQTQGFSDAQVDRTAQFAATNEGFASGFEDAGDALTKGFGDTSTQLTNTQANVLEGQGNLDNTLDTMQGAANAYATTQLENQANIQSNQDGFVTNFDSYVDRYSDDTTLADKSRADMATAQANQNDRLREDIGAYAQTAATGQAAVSNQLSDTSRNLTDAVTGGFSSVGADQLQTQENIQSNQDALSSQFSDQVGGIQNKLEGGFQTMDVNSINQAKDLAAVAATQTDMDMGMRQNFQQLSTAFDDNGQLVRNSIDAQGNTLTRNMDAQGNLLLKSFDVTGNEIGNKVININRSLMELGNMKNLAGANTSMGNLSPAMQGNVPTGGFMSPFSQTR